jgi:hypothetical protein
MILWYMETRNSEIQQPTVQNSLMCFITPYNVAV